MAQQSGLLGLRGLPPTWYTNGFEPQHIEWLVQFSNLVAAAEREGCAKVCEQAGIDGYGTIAAALLIRERGAP
jgi:hypothetical protein